jgi:VPDSG-CTERM motif
MKRANIFGILVAMAITPAAMANTIHVTQTPGAHFSAGGELTATTTPTEILGLQTQGPGTFQTFCIESHVNLDTDLNYSYTKGQTDHAGVTLKLGTAWLFDQFNHNALPGYAHNVTQAGLLQGAIWFFQGQTANPASDASGYNISASNPYVIDAITALGASAGNASAGALGVVVLQLTHLPDGAAGQDLLGQVPVPDGGATIALLGLALVGFESLRRRLA